MSRRSSRTRGSSERNEKTAGFERTAQAQTRDDLFDPSFSLEKDEQEEDSTPSTSTED